MSFEYKPIDRLHARPEGENTGDLKFPFYILAILAACVGAAVLLLIGIAKLFP